MEKKKYYFTFGHGKKHFPGYTVIESDSDLHARKEMVRRFGLKWSHQYSNLEDVHILDRRRELVWSEPVVVHHEVIEEKFNCIFDTSKTSESEWEDTEIPWSIVVSHNNKKCVASLSVNNGVYEQNYYNLVFEDGVILRAVSSLHLNKI